MYQNRMPRKLNALLIDDSAVTRKLIRESLCETGLAEFCFTEAQDGLDALEKFDAENTDIIFVDLHMPRMDGRQFLDELHKQYPKAPPAVMITSEESMEKVMTVVKEADVDGFLFKPVDAERLRKGLRTLVDALPDRSGPSAVPNGECIAQALMSVLRRTCELDATPTAEDTSVRDHDIVFGTFTVLGEVQWSVVIGFAREAALSVAGRFASMEFDETTDALGDALGEVINIIAGQTKSLLSQRGLHAEMSLPTICCARELKVLTLRKMTQDHMHFDSPAGKMWIGVTVGLHQGVML